MNYYIIPKNNFNISINVLSKNEDIVPLISYSLIYYLNEIYSQLLSIEFDDTETTLEYINKIVNPFEFIHTNVPGYFLSVSKVKPSSNIFFELMEIFQVCNIIETLTFKKQFHIAHITKNNSSTNYLIDMLRENNKDIIINEDFDYSKLCETFVSNFIYETKIDMFIFEFNESDYINTNQYIKNMLLVFYIIIKYQAENGICIIKIDNIFYKTILDILFIFSGIYDKVIIIKPSISKITKGERYLICKNLNTNILNSSNLLQQLDTYIKPRILNTNNNVDIVHSLIRNEIPYYFTNKIEEINAVIGQQQLEAYDQILNILKNKNRNDKIEILKRNNIQKCIQWCEKNRLPHNKFIDKFNIFLNSQKKQINDEPNDEPNDKINEIKEEINGCNEIMLYNNLLNDIEDVEDVKDVEDVEDVKDVKDVEDVENIVNNTIDDIIKYIYTNNDNINNNNI